MILVCGATGELGGRVARRLAREGAGSRAGAARDAMRRSWRRLGVEVVRGDLTDATSLAPALAGVTTVVTTANAISRILSGAGNATIAGVDGSGNQNLIRAAHAAGVSRFVFVSLAGMGPELAGMGPLPRAKWAAEQALGATAHAACDRASGHVPGGLARPDDGHRCCRRQGPDLRPRRDAPALRGRSTTWPTSWRTWPWSTGPPDIVEFGGPEALSRMDVVALFERAKGAPLKVRHVPRAALSAGHRVLARPKPEIASLMGMALYADTHPATWDDAPLRDVGIAPRPATEFIRTAVLGERAPS